MQKLIDTTPLHTELILNYTKYEISDQEYICITKLMTFDKLYVDFLIVLKEIPNVKPIISSLVTKKIVNIIDIDGRMVIDFNPLYQLFNEQVAVKASDATVNREQIEKLTHLLGRNIKPNEINQINTWLKGGSTFSDIEEAFYETLSRGISNFNYVQKILENEKSVEVQSENPIKRNWTY